MRQRFRKMGLLLLLVAMACLPAQGFASSPDSIISGDIKEADGTSGQDTNTGTGIKTNHIQSSAVTTDKLADGAVTTLKVTNGAIIDTKLGINAVTNAKIADGAVTTGKIADASITNAKIGADAVYTSNIADNSVTNSKIADGAVTAVKLGAGAVGSNNIASGAVTTANIADGAVSSSKIGLGAVSTSAIMDTAVTTIKIVDSAVTTDKLADGAVTDAKITGPISAYKISGLGTDNIVDGAVIASKIADGAVTDAKITGPISGEKLGAHAHYGSDIVDGTITSSKIAEGAVTDSKISGPIAAEKITGIVGMGNYAKIKVVHKGSADGTNTFNSLTAAIQAIGPNTAERYAIVVMPGTYTENFSFLDPWYISYNIDIIGESRTGSIIKPTGNHWNNYSNYRPYIHLPDRMTLKNISIEGIVDLSGDVGVSVVDCFINVTTQSGLGAGIMSHYPQKVTIDNVDIIGDGSGMWLYNYWDVDNIVLNNIRIKLTEPDAGGIWIYPSQPTPIKFSNISITGTGTNGWAFAFFSYDSGLVELDNVTINGQLPPFAYSGSGTISVNARNCNFNSTANLINGSGSSYLNFSIDNSVINNVVSSSASPVKIGNSKIAGPLQPVSGLVTVVNSYNGSYQPIPNGSY